MSDSSLSRMLRQLRATAIPGIGVTVLPAVAAEAELRDGRLIALPWTGCHLDISVRMIRNKDKHLSPTILASQEIVHEILAPALSMTSREALPFLREPWSCKRR